MTMIERLKGSVLGVLKQCRVIWALLLRELATRYGRDNLGFLWLVGEPLLFCGGVLIVWSLIRPPYEHGLRLAPFLLTGYVPLTLMRHILGQCTACLKVNSALLYHRGISLIALFIARVALEIIGVTIAFIVGFCALFFLGLMALPKDMGLVYLGWLNLAFLFLGIGIIFGCLSVFSDAIEKAVGVISYLLVPISGTFVMVAWLPPRGQEALLAVPIVHNVEMIRAGFFGEFVETHFDVRYALLWSVIMLFCGLLLLRFVRNRIEIE